MTHSILNISHLFQSVASSKEKDQAAPASSPDQQTTTPNTLAELKEEMGKAFAKETQNMRQAFKQEKESMRQAFADEMKCLVDENSKATAGILQGLKTLKEQAEKASSELEKKFATEFAKELAKQMVAGDAAPSKPKGKKFNNFQDMGNYVDVENKL